MPRYIDADAMLAEAKRLSGPQTGDGWDNWGVYALIERQPTADVVEVVRCKDCIHRPEADGQTSWPEVTAPRDSDGRRDATCPYICVDPWFNTMPDDDWFCADGEKREDNP